MIKPDNNALARSVKTTYELMNAREQKIYELGFKAGQKSITNSHHKPFVFVPDYQPVNNENIFDIIISVVTSYFRVSKKEIMSTNRHQYIIIPRSIVINLMRELTRFSLPQIAALCDKDHTSILYHVTLRISKKGIWKESNNHAIYNELKERVKDESNKTQRH